MMINDQWNSQNFLSEGASDSRLMAAEPDFFLKWINDILYLLNFHLYFKINLFSFAKVFY